MLRLACSVWVKRLSSQECWCIHCVVIVAEYVLRFIETVFERDKPCFCCVELRWWFEHAVFVECLYANE